MSDAAVPARVAEWRDRAETMTLAWRRLRHQVRDERRSRRQRQVADWRQTIDEMQHRQVELRRTGRWLGGPTHLLGVVGRARRETVHSAAVAWLLNPTRHHGLGVSLLDGVLQRCFPETDFPEMEWARPECEVARNGGRVDIVVWAPDWTVIIENKVDAVENPGQCDAYYRAFTDDPDPHFVFLSPSGRRPRTATGAAARAYRNLSYQDLIDCLAKALDESANVTAAGRPAAEQYLACLREEF